MHPGGSCHKRCQPRSDLLDMSAWSPDAPAGSGLWQHGGDRGDGPWASWAVLLEGGLAWGWVGCTGRDCMAGVWAGQEGEAVGRGGRAAGRRGRPLLSSPSCEGRCAASRSPSPLSSGPTGASPLPTLRVQIRTRSASTRGLLCRVVEDNLSLW